MEQSPGEDLMVYGSRLLKQAKRCGFSGNLMKIVADHMTMSSNCHELALTSEDMFMKLFENLVTYDREETEVNNLVQEMSEIELD